MLTSWSVSADQLVKYREQFLALHPTDGLLAGDQLKGFFLSSGQPPQILAQVWNLSDLNKDGKLDQQEFVIAMYLLDRVSMGATLPPALPGTLLATATLQSKMPQDFAQPLVGHRSSAAPNNTVDIVAWLESNKAKYSDSFRAMQQVKNGFLAGRDARVVLGRFGLSNDILAHVWFLSDLDKDGRLTCEEFCLAMGYVDAYKSGQKLPAAPPSELIAATRQRNKSVGSLSVDSSVEGSVDLSEEFKLRTAKTFEDRRRENFEKGQAELERRRQQLLKMEQQEREERERKEREEQARKERERQEVERRRQLQLEKELAKQREEQLRLEEEHRKIMEQKEAARRQLERQRLIEWEKMRLNELANQRQGIVENLLHNKQQSKNVACQLKLLRDKSSELAEGIANLHRQVYELTESFGLLKSERDDKLACIERCKRLISQHEQRSAQFDADKRLLNERCLASKTALSLSEPYDQLLSRCDTKKLAVQGLRKNLLEIDQEVDEKRERCASLRSSYDALCQEAKVEWFENQELIRQAKTKLRARFNRPPEATGALCPSAAQSTCPLGAQRGSEAPVTARYRALYEFVARTEDELSFQPGDVIFVFKNHASEPGWLAGQIKDKVGWFPEAFAECITSDGGTLVEREEEARQTLHAAQKLESINEESFEREEMAVETSSGRPLTKSRHSPPLARALYNWKGKADNHLCFTRGNLIRIVEQQEMWWKGQMDGKEGWFPKSYVKIEKDEQQSCPVSPVHEQMADNFSATVEKAYSSDGLSVGNCQQVVDVSCPVEQVVQEKLDLKKASLASESEEWCTAIYSFVASEPGDLAFNAGDRILVLQKDADWWTGRVGDCEGIFPANYVKSCEPTTPAEVQSVKLSENGSVDQRSMSSASQEAPFELGKAIAPFKAADGNQLPLELGDIVKIRTKSPTGWWEGEKEQNGGRRLGWFPGSYVQVLKTSALDENEADSDSATVGKGASGRVEALYDYTAAQQGELSFKQGDLIDILEKTDNDWWTGQLSSGQRGLLPANYVKSVDDDIRSSQLPEGSIVGCSSSWDDVAVSTGRSAGVGGEPGSSLGCSGASGKRWMCFEELLKSEKNYLDDLIVVRDVFQKPMIRDKSLSRVDADAVFVNWNDLIKLAKCLLNELRNGGEQAVGQRLLEMRADFDAFATFGEHLRSALDCLDHRLTTSVPFRTSHAKCCANAKTRSLPLNYFLLIPMARFTRYPLVLKELLKYTPPAHRDYANLQKAYDELKSLCERVNRLASETENLHTLHWCQSHIRCDDLQPALCFNTTTNRLGPRRFLYAGAVYKVKSNRLLVAFLFNDMLMLTTPDQPIVDPVAFKVSVNCESTFTMYKRPVLLAHANFQTVPSGDDLQFSLSADEHVYNFKAISSNARLLWKKQLESVIEHAQKRKVTVVKHQPTFKHCIGRVSVDVQCVRNLPVPTDCTACPIMVELKVAESKQLISVDLNRKDSASLCSAQFLFDSAKAIFSVKFIVELQLSPSIIVGQMCISVDDMLKMAGPDRNPVVKQFPLTGQLIGEQVASSAVVTIKFSVNVFNG